MRIFMHRIRDAGAPRRLDRARSLCAHRPIVGYAPADRWSPPPPHDGWAPRRTDDIDDEGRRPRDRYSENQNNLALRRTWPVRRPVADRRRGGLHRADTGAGTGDPIGARGQGRPRRRADGHRQDGRLHAADPRPAPAAGEHLVLAGPAPGPLPRPDADARARRPGRRERQDLQPPRAAAVGGRVRRRAARPPDQGAPGRHRDPRGHARAPARPRRPARGEPRPGRDPRARRGRPDAGHGLHARHPPHPRPAAVAPADAAVLGDVLGRHQAPRGLDPARPGDDRGRPATAPPPRACASSSTRSIATARRSCSPT